MKNREANRRRSKEP